MELDRPTAEGEFKWHYRIIWFLGVMCLFDNSYAMIATRFAFAGPWYYIQILSGLALIVLGFLVKKRSLYASRFSVWIVAINFLIGWHMSYQNFGIGIVTIGNALWAFFMLFMRNRSAPHQRGRRLTRPAGFHRRGQEG
jgi:hypothetical protein